jgi:hypothetical protein
MDKRKEYFELLSAQLLTWNEQIDRLKEKAKAAAPDLNCEYYRIISTLELKRDEAAAKLQGLTIAGEDEWEELKAGTEKLWEEVRTIIHDAIVNIA